MYYYIPTIIMHNISTIKIKNYLSIIFLFYVGISWTKIWVSSNTYVYYFIRIGIIKGGID